MGVSAAEIAWQRRLCACLLPAPDHRRVSWRLGGHVMATDLRLIESAAASLRPAAVLVPIMVRDGDGSVLFTRRSGALRHHAGQISFPGGGVEATDQDIAAAAIRETGEEIGIAARYIKPLGFLVDHVVLTGFRITPVVALIDSACTLRLDAAEVDSVFEVPFREIMQLDRYEQSMRQLNEHKVPVWHLNAGSDVIWGATAGMLRTLAMRYADRIT